MPAVIDEASPVPLYAQIAEALRGRFAALPVGTRVPSEPELQGEFGVSRETIRRAFELLTADHLVTKRRGRGTFTTQPPLTHNLSGLTSWTEQLEAAGAVPSTSGLRVVTLAPPPEVAALAELGEGEVMTLVDRLRLADGEPICRMQNYLRADLVEGLDADDIGEASLYQVLRQRFGVRLTLADDTLEARPCPPDLAEQLAVRRGAPVLQNTRVSRTADGRVAEVAFVISRGDRYRYRARLINELDVEELLARKPVASA